jgi:hypothetical protein
MTSPRFFIHVSAASVEDLIDSSERHGVLIEARGYLPPSRFGVYGSLEIAPSDSNEKGTE